MAKHLLFIVAYTLFAVPWYWTLLPESWAMQRVYGLPMWVAFAIAGSFGVSLHACLIFCRPWPMETDAAEKEKAEKGTGTEEGTVAP